MFYIDVDDDLKDFMAQDFSGLSYDEDHDPDHYNVIRPELDKMRFIAADAGESPSGVGSAWFIVAEYGGGIFFFCEEHCSCYGFGNIRLDDYVVTKEAFSKFKYADKYKNTFDPDDRDRMADTIARVDKYVS